MPSVEESVATIKAELKYLKEQGALAELAYKDIESLLPRVRPQPPVAGTMGQDNEIVEALYAFQPQQDGDLALKPGDKIEILEKLSPEWYKGKCNGQVGVFPSNYVKSVDTKDVEKRSSSATPVANLPQYAAYTPPGQQMQVQQPVQQQSPFPPQFTGYYQQPVQQQMQQYPQQQPQEQPQQQSSHQGSAAFKKFGSKLGNAAIFGAGATIGSDLVNSIF